MNQIDLIEYGALREQVKGIGDRVTSLEKTVNDKFAAFEDKLDKLIEEKSELKGGIKVWHLVATGAATLLGLAVSWFHK